MRLLLPCLVACSVGHAAPPANRASAPRMVALDHEDRDSFAIFSVDRDGVQRIATGLRGEQFGWLDEHTLLVASVDDKRIAIARYVDGRRDGGYTVTDAAWVQPGFTELLLAGDEVWISRCVASCERHEYRRVAPSPLDAKDPPRDLDRGRVNFHTRNPWPRRAVVAAPKGVSLAASTVDVVIPGPPTGAPTTRVDRRPGAACRAGAATRTYPAREPTYFEMTVVSLGFVQLQPPIFELELRTPNPAMPFTQIVYARPCEPELGAYAWLGGDMYATFTEVAQGDGDWTFFAGGVAVGKVHGFGRLRPNIVR